MVVTAYPCDTNSSRAASSTARRVARACSVRRGEWYVLRLTSLGTLVQYLTNDYS